MEQDARVWYRHSSRSWGIFIEMHASIQITADDDDHLMAVAPRVQLMRAPTCIHLIEPEEYYLACGLQWMVPTLWRSFSSAPYLRVIVHELLFAETDVQPEGFACVMMRWVGVIGACTVPSVPVHFDPRTNRYIFDFSAFEQDPIITKR
jgi:hypothetical protein